MRIFFTCILCCYLFKSNAQRLDLSSMENILKLSYGSADSILNKSKFDLADKDAGEGYINYYYTSYEKTGKKNTTIRSLSLMDVYSETDTSRLILYRTYTKSDQDDISAQLRSAGYEITKRIENIFTYKKGSLVIINRVAEKNLAADKTVTAYEFELGR